MGVELRQLRECVGEAMRKAGGVILQRARVVAAAVEMIDQLRVERELALKRRGDGPPDESCQPPAPASRRRRRDQRVPRLVDRRQNRCVVQRRGG